MQKLNLRRVQGLCWLLVGLALVSCSSKTHRFTVDGVGDKFCVPKTGYVAPGVWFVPEDSPSTPQGFSFGGCHRLQQADRRSCTLPAELMDADVDPLSVHHNRTWKDLKEAAVYDAVVTGSAVEYTIDPVTGSLVVFNQEAWPSWFVWKQRDASDGGSALSLHDSDELIVSCSAIEDFPGTDGLGGKGDYGCARYVKGPSYALNYRFVSKVRVPSEEQLKHLETALFDQVDRWRCQK